jgi:hypothetical protein
VAGQRGLEFGEDVAGAGNGRSARCGFGDGPVRGSHGAEGPDADEGIAADGLAAFDGFQQEGLGLVGGDAQEGGDGGFEVGRHGAGDGNQGVGAREFGEIAEVRRGWCARGRHFYEGIAVTGMRVSDRVRGSLPVPQMWA